MAVVTPYPVSTVDARAIPNVNVRAEVPAANDIGSFGGNQARDMMVAGANLDRGSDALGNYALREMKQANDTAVEDRLNGAIDTLQKSLHEGPDAYFRKKGRDAIDGAQPMLDSLTKLKTDTVGAAANPYQRERLGKFMDGLIQDARKRIDGHVEREVTAWEKTTRETRLALAQKNVALNPEDNEALDNSLGAARGVALEEAKTLGIPADSDTAKLMVDKAQSTVLRTGMQSLLDQGRKRAALQLYDRVKDNLAFRDDHALAAAMKGVRTEVEGEETANSALAKYGAPAVPGTEGGTRTYNIGNITKSGFNYAGKGQPDGPFETFATPEQGVAAAYMTIQAKARQNGGALSFKDLIGGNGKVQGWAPADDGKTPLLKGNNPGAYASQLAQSVGLGANDNIPLEDEGKMAAVLRTMNRIEHGKQTVPDASYAGGIKLAQGGATPASPIAPGGPQYKGDVGAVFRSAMNDVANDPNKSKEVRDNALALLSKQRTALEGYQTSATKSLKDEANTYRAGVYLGGPADPTKLAAFAERADQLGEQELATTYRLYAAILPTLKNGLAMARPDQLNMLKSLEEGLPKKLLEGVKINDPEALQAANDAFTKLKQRVADGLPTGPDDVKPVARMFGDLGRSEKVREIGDWANAALGAQGAMKLPRAQQDQLMSDLEASARSGQGSEQQAMLYHELKAGMARQDGAFRNDAFSAGAKLLGEQAPPLNFADPNLGVTLAQRAAMADRINALRPGANALPLSKSEIAAARDYIAKAGPDGALTTISVLSSLPDEHKLGVAAAIAGHGTADPLSQMYASAMAKWAENTPEGRQAATAIVRGAEIIKNAGESQKKISATAPVFQQAMNDKLGNALAMFSGTDVPSEMTEAVRATYAWLADKAGKQHDPAPDDTLLRQAIDQVTGGVIKFRGQQVFAPAPGASSYALSAALNRLQDSDLPGLKSEEGKAITADMIKSNGVLYSVGDGQYLVKLPDRGGELKPVMDPRTGQGYVLGFRGLMERGGNEIAPADFNANNALGRFK